MMSYQGVDLSHWNQPEDMWKHITPNFIICKASEGKTIKDWTCKRYYLEAFCNNLSYGLYHFAHPEKNTVQDEVNNFIEVAETFPDEVIELIALDIEGDALKAKDLEIWCMQWILEVRLLYPEAKILLYCSQGECKRFSKSMANQVNLWVARYRKFELGYGDVSPWKEATIWQYDSKGVDKNIFYMKGEYHETNTDQEEERPQNLYADCKGH